MAHLSQGPIMVVEDDPDSRAMLATVLELTGRPVVTAANGMEAYNLARRHHPSMIILDLMMPVMTGEEFRKAQLASPEIRGIPIVVLSAHHEAPRIARQMRAAGCLMKPVDFDALAVYVSRFTKS